MVELRSESDWPPKCCVPAFCREALVIAGMAPPTQSEMAHALGVRVSSGDNNPFELDVIEEERLTGVTPENAEASFNNLASSRGYLVRLRHVRFNTIAFGLYEEVLHCALRKGLTVGVGLKFDLIVGKSLQGNTRHLLRLLECSGSNVQFIDDSGEWKLDRRELSWRAVEEAVLAAQDGFWFIGPPENLSLEYTLPFLS